MKEKPAEAGHNSGISADRLKSFVKRIEKVEEDKAAVAEDLKEIYSEAKSAGFDTKIIRKLVSLRKIEIEKRREEQELLDLYMSSIGRTINKSTTTDILQHVYDQEQGFTISCFWDAGITLKIGDEMNGFKEKKHFNNFNQLATYLKERFQ